MTHERRLEARTPLRRYANPFYGALRKAIDTADTTVGALGIFLVAGLLVSAACTAAFVEVAEHVRAGSTQMFDESIIRWLAAHRSGTLDATMLEITALGTGTVVMVIVAVASLFLVLTQHKYSALLLLVSTFGGLVLDGVLKLGFNRPRPTIVVHAVQAVSSSFPSGHAMSSAIVYSTVAYLAARLHKRWWARFLVMLTALVLIVLICLSRLYLGVHYPSDVLAGVLVGLAWAAFCMATLEAIQKFGIRRDPRILEAEKPAPAPGVLPKH
ncbi:MAG TPA: phosphatase PAP2 family protein [Gemmatimonadaceae bacterium]|jgi:undecaprenyl-diphosphatase